MSLSPTALLARHGRSITLRRPGSPNTDTTINAKITGFAVDQLIGEVTQSDRKVVIAAADLGSWPAPPRRGDQVIVDGKIAVVQAAESRHDGASIVRWDLRVTGLA